MLTDDQNVAATEMPSTTPARAFETRKVKRSRPIRLSSRTSSVLSGSIRQSLRCRLM